MRTGRRCVVSDSQRVKRPSFWTKKLSVSVAHWLSIAVLFIAVGSNTAAGQSYSYHRSITVDHTKVPNTDQSNFPVLISGTYSYLATVGNGGNVQNANGYDIIFTSDAAGTSKLDHEIDSYNPTTGAVSFWVRIPTLSHTSDTVIYMQYGNAAITSSQENKAGVWQGGYQSVYHFGNSGTAVGLSDSGGAGYNLTHAGSVSVVSGKFGSASTFNGSPSNYLYHDSVGSYASGTSPLTLEAWIQASGSLTGEVAGYGDNSHTGARAAIYGDGNGNAFLEFDSLGISEAYPADGQWHHVVGVYPGGTAAQIYLDGVQKAANQNFGTPSITTTELKIGGIPTVAFCCAFSGNVDEVRISSVARSADWIATEYNNHNSPSTFYAVGLDAPTITGLSPSAGAIGTSVTITGSGFGTSPGTVAFNGTAATVSSWSNTSVTAIVPTGATTGSVVVTAAGGVASPGVGFTVTGAPSISSLTPNTGVVGSSTVIAGSNFGPSQGNGSVTFNGTPATTITNWSATSITAVVPTAATSGNVVVTAAGGIASSGVGFTVIPTPNISGLSPTSGLVGASVTISGTNFGASQGNSEVTFNGVPAVPTSWSATSIAVSVPNGATSGNVVVTVGSLSSNGVSFTVITQPSIAAVNPTSGLNGQLVTVTGSNFGATQGSSTLTFNGTPATNITSWSATAIVAVVPASATSGNVVVTAGGQTSNGVPFTVINGPPAITSVSPISGPVGTSVTIGGINFGATQGNSYVTFNGTTATPTSWSATSIAVPVPSGATTGYIVVTVGGVPSLGACFAISASAPCINSLSPTSGSNGTAVSISGINFGGTQGTSSVSLNTAPATVTSWGNSTIGINVPVNVASGPVTVTVGGVASNGVQFTVPIPKIINLSPDSGRPGTPITITGSGFGAVQGASTVNFNGVAATATSWSDTAIVAPVPASATTGLVFVNVANTQGSGASFTVTAAPAITSLSPASGPVNALVTISGAGFGSPQGTGTIKFNGTAAAPISWGDTTILAPVPQGATTGPVVVTAGGLNSNNSTFTVTPAPSITNISPASGAAGTSVTITGSNFGTSQGTSAVRFNGAAATTTAWSTGSITATAPSGVSTGPVTVTVSGQASNGVTFTAVVNGTLSGSVTNASGGAGINGAAVQALQNGTVKGSATTDSSGAYTISNLASGSYDITVTASGFGTAMQSPVSIVAGQTTTSNFSLAGPGTISGKVTQSDGVTAISGATVQVFVGGEAGSTATSDGSGNYSVGSLNTGTYRVQASASGYVTKSQSVTLSGGGTSTANFSLQNPGANPVSYVYDELGRLIGVIDPSGDAATYTYDAVGNILAIGRYSSAQVSIISFTPASGAVGSTVTINGTGFSTTASQNAVSFNGTSAGVTSATANQLVVTVPAGATTGPITVTAPAGTAVSAASFSVVTASSAPTITSFTPTSEAVGAAVTVTGTNFDLSPPSNKLSFNITRSPVVSATATSMSTTVPSASASGHLTVVTPNGSAVSSQDFFIPFGTHPAGDIGYTGRTTMGGTQTVTLSTANQIGLLIFDATAGQGVSLGLSGSTFANCTIYIFDPRGNTLLTSSCTSSTTVIGSTFLPVTGTYTIGIEPGSSTGSIGITLNRDFDATIAIDGPAVTATTNAAGEDARLTFSATAAQRIVVYITNVTNPQSELFLVTPGGTTQVLVGNVFSGHTYFVDTQTLATAGTYTLWLMHAYNYVGSETFQIANVPADPTATLTVPAAGATGPTSTVTTTAAGQNATFTFSGTAAQKLSFNVTNSTVGSSTGDCYVTVKDPSNAQVATGYCGAGGQPVIDTVTLGSTGTYTILIDPQTTTTGSVTMSINNAADVTRTIAIDGSAVTVTTTVPGQDGRLTFSATAGQRIVLYVTSVTNPSAYVYLVKPDGTNQTSLTIYTSSGTFFMDTQPLSTTGTYTLWVQHYSTYVGSETLQIASVPADITGTIAVGGPTVQVPSSGNTSVGQNATLTFTGTAGQQVRLNLTNPTFGSSAGACSLTVKDPSNGTVTSGNCGTGAGSTIGPFTTNTNGTYTIVIDPVGMATGSVTIGLTTP